MSGALDLPTRRAQHAQRLARDLGLVKHERVELILGVPLGELLHDDESADVAKTAPLALAPQEVDHRVTVSTLMSTSDRAPALRIGRALTIVVTTTSRCSRGRAIDHAFFELRLIFFTADIGMEKYSASSPSLRYHSISTT